MKPFNAVIQICPNCGKVDAYQDDGHDCVDEQLRQEANEKLGKIASVVGVVISALRKEG
jgi:hypothetical protein